MLFETDTRPSVVADALIVLGDDRCHCASADQFLDVANVLILGFFVSYCPQEALRTDAGRKSPRQGRRLAAVRSSEQIRVSISMNSLSGRLASQR